MCQMTSCVGGRWARTSDRERKIRVPSGVRVFGYPIGWLSSDLVAGITLAAYAIPVSLAYATLAGLPPQIGVYGYLMGGLGYALAGSSRYLAIGPTSAISLMIAGTVGDMVGDYGARYAEIATAAAIGVGRVLPDRVGVQAQRAGQADQRQRPDRVQGWRRADHRDHAVAGTFGGRRGRPQCP